MTRGTETGFGDLLGVPAFGPGLKPAARLRGLAFRGALGLLLGA